MIKPLLIAVFSLVCLVACSALKGDVGSIIKNRQDLTGKRVSFNGYFCMETGTPSIYVDYLSCKDSKVNSGFELVLSELVIKRHELYGSGGYVNVVGVLHVTPDNVVYTDKFFQLGYVEVEKIHPIESEKLKDDNYLVSLDKDKNLYMRDFLVNLHMIAKEKNAKKIEDFLELNIDSFYKPDRDSQYSRIDWFFHDSKYSLANFELKEFDFYVTKGRFTRYWVCAKEGVGDDFPGLVRLGVSSMLRGQGKLCLYFIEDSEKKDLFFVPMQILTN